MFGDYLRCELAHAKNFLGLNANIRRLTLRAAARLVNENARIRQSESLTFCAGRQKQSTHGGALADTNSGDVRADKLHRIVDGHAGGDRTARRIDINVDVFLWVFSFEKKKLRHD